MSAVLAVVVGIVVLLAGTLPRNALFVANLRFHPELPWAVPIIAGYLVLFWWYLRRAGTADLGLRANPLPWGSWWRALVAGGFGVVALVFALRVVNRMVVLPDQGAPGFDGVAPVTIGSLLLISAPFAGVVEESAFRGFMQAPLERRLGVGVAILITGTMFALVHLDFTLVLWPYYLAVALIYGLVSYFTDSILPAIVLHTAGNTWSNLDLWLRGRAEWQAAKGPDELIWTTGPDRAFWLQLAGLLVTAGVAAVGYRALARWERRRGVARFTRPAESGGGAGR